MFSLFSFSKNAILAISLIASSVNFKSTLSILSISEYCIMIALSGSLIILTKSSSVKLFKSTCTGNLPCNSGIRSLTLVIWNAPAAINSIKSVLILPYFVLTVLPSTIGKISLCTPSRLTSGPLPSPAFEAILSISSKNIMPSCSASFRPSEFMLSWSIILLASSVVKCFKASETVIFFFFFCLGIKRPRTSPKLVSLPPNPIGPKCMLWGACSISISSGTLSSLPLLKSFQTFSFNSSSLISGCFLRIAGNIALNSLLSAYSFAFGSTSAIFISFTMRIAASTKSLTMLSTSRPTYPTSVNLVASTFTKGALTSLAKRRAISVFPTPVGPFIIIFLGVISSLISGVSILLR